MLVGIIGTAGRKEDGARLSKALWDTMVSHSMLAIEQLVPESQEVHLVSGGAAVADHLAVRLYLDKVADSLTLHLPAPFSHSRFQGSGSKLDAGRIANYYHDNFRFKTHVDSLRDIQRAIDAGAKTTVSQGFHARNILVGKVDLLLAYTFGTHSSLVKQQHPGWKQYQLAGLKDGGTAHTWDNSPAPIKLHTNLMDWC